MVASAKIDVKSLITHRFKFEDAEQAFKLVKKGQEDVLKVVIEGVL
jgi:D-xylulose reductase